MKTRRTIASLAVIVSAAIVLLCLGTSVGVEKTYEVETYSLPEYRTDTGRAIDAYQQMVNRLLDQNERNSGHLQRQLMDLKSHLNEIEASLARIEKKLGIEQTSVNEPKQNDGKNTPSGQNKPKSKTSSSPK